MFEQIRTAVSPIPCWRQTAPQNAQVPYVLAVLLDRKGIFGDDRTIAAVERWHIYLVVAQGDESRIDSLRSSIATVVPVTEIERKTDLQRNITWAVLEVSGYAQA